jgi:Lipid A 3-O-deacylase (PagL)
VRFALVLIAAIPLYAGFCSPPDGSPRHEFELFAGYSPVNATVIGTATDRRFIAAGFTYGYRCWMWKNTSISFTPTVLPAAILLQPSETLYNFTPPYQRVSPAHAVYGFGVAPIGFTFDFWRTHRVHPYAEMIGGLIASTEPIPENQPNATGLNFLFDLGAGVRIHAVSLGYRFLHISNADTTGFNPGIDNNIFYVGYSFTR